jgi:hypothetical protein
MQHLLFSQTISLALVLFDTHIREHSLKSWFSKENNQVTNLLQVYNKHLTLLKLPKIRISYEIG